jgi:hypothetical protein
MIQGKEEFAEEFRRVNGNSPFSGWEKSWVRGLAQMKLALLYALSPTLSQRERELNHS